MTFTESTDQDLRTYAEAFNDFYQGERPDVEPEDRTYVEYNDVEQVSDAERAAVERMDAIASFDFDGAEQDRLFDEYQREQADWEV